MNPVLVPSRRLTAVPAQATLRPLQEARHFPKLMSGNRPLTAPSTNPLAGKAPLLVAMLLVVDSLHFVFARLLEEKQFPATAGAMYVLSVGTVEVALFLAWQRRIRWAVFRQHARFFLVVGFLVACSTAVNYTAVAYIDPGTASLLGQTSIVFALAFSLLWLRERLSRLEWAGAGLAVLGVFVISFQQGDYLRLGSLLVLGSAFMYALHAAVVKRHGGEMDFANFFLFRVLSTTAFLLIFTTAQKQWVWPAWPVWQIILLAGTSDVAVSRVLYYLVLRRLPMSFHAILLTLSPVITILWSLLLFGESPARQGLIGGAAVIAGVVVVTQGKRRA
ncbi:MAG: DMT family transporter [Chloroflexi bacterium]|nr:DMT family transporter [Chloroflexota bacterium]MCI0576434.1 DMT family transporter [Chloroflexota bacterium]MCI0648930.1 DMT family transporter [Chloroflexota bacterium]MCI0730861.1 DMT family transporter [Chloroflexota bacterium]